jgi:hypothetical protein
VRERVHLCEYNFDTNVIVKLDVVVSVEAFLAYKLEGQQRTFCIMGR